MLAGAESAFAVQLKNEGQTAVAGVRVLFDISGTANPDDVSILYKEGVNWLRLPLAAAAGKLTGAFGPDTGFPVAGGYDATSQFKVTFAKAGTYSASFRAVQVATPAIPLATTTWDVSVLPGLVLTSGGPHKTVVDHESTVTVTLSNPTATPVDGVSVAFEIAGVASGDDVSIKYREGNTWAPLPVAFDEANGTVVGTVGPAGGFPVPAGYDQTSVFKVTYHAPSTYTATFRAMSGGAVIAEAAKTVEVTLEHGKSQAEKPDTPPTDSTARHARPGDPGHRAGPPGLSRRRQRLRSPEERGEAPIRCGRDQVMNGRTSPREARPSV